MEIGLVIVGVAVLSAASMLLLARYAPRVAPPGLTAALSGHTPAGHAWTLNPDYSDPRRISWVWRVALSTDPFAAWRGERLTWDAAAHRATGRVSDPPDGEQRAADWTVRGEQVPPAALAALATAPVGVTAVGWDIAGWVSADLPSSESPESVVAFAARLADALSPPRADP